MHNIPPTGLLFYNLHPKVVMALLSLIILGRLQPIPAITIPSKTQERKVTGVASLSIPTITLTSDFQKDNVSAAWAAGHPKQWGTEDARFEYPIALTNYYFAGTVSEDEKFIAMINGSHAKFVALVSNNVVSEFPLRTQRGEEMVLLLRANGGYNLVVSNDDSVSLVQISPEGKPAGEPSKLPDRLSPFGVRYTSKDG